MSRKIKDAPCPCGGTQYASCCGRFIEQGQVPQSAVELMRSRYTAYVRGDEAYLKNTWHPSPRPAERVADGDAKWLGLEVRKAEQEGDAATVEFVARYRIGGRAQRLHEVSRFVREEGKWYYVDGTFPESQ